MFALPFKCVVSDLVRVGGDVLDGNADSLLAWTARTSSTLRPLALLLPEGLTEGQEERPRPSALPAKDR